MALSLDQLNAITHKFIQKRLFDNIFDSNPLLKRMLKGGQYVSQAGGTSVDIPLNYAQTDSSGWYSGAEALDTTDSENITAARFTFRNLYAGVSITEEDNLKNNGPEGELKLLDSKVQIAERTIRDLLGTAIYSNGTDAKSVVGLDDIIAENQTVGQISQTDYSWWRGQLDDSTTTMTMSALNSLYEDCVVDSDKPTVAMATRANYNRYYNLLTPQQRFVDTKTASGGWTSLMFNSIPFISDSHATANSVYFLNEAHLWLYYHPERNFKMAEWQKPTNQEVRLSRVLWMGLLGSSNNRFHGRFSALTS